MYPKNLMFRELSIERDQSSPFADLKGVHVGYPSNHQPRKLTVFFEGSPIQIYACWERTQYGCFALLSTLIPNTQIPHNSTTSSQQAPSPTRHIPNKTHPQQTHPQQAHSQQNAKQTNAFPKTFPAEPSNNFKKTAEDPPKQLSSFLTLVRDRAPRCSLQSRLAGFLCRTGEVGELDT